MFGNYTCVATNNLGTHQDTTTLSGLSLTFFFSMSGVGRTGWWASSPYYELVQTIAE